MNFGIENLKALIALHQEGSFSAAASKLGITQSALSKRIQSLEQQVLHRVVDRNTRSARLTAAGEKLVLLARQIEKITAAAVVDFEHPDHNHLSGIVRIAASSSHLRPLLLPALSSLVRTHNGIHLSVHQGAIKEVEEMLLDLRVDFALTDRKANTVRKVKYHLIGEEKFVVIRPKSGSNQNKFLGTVPSDPTFNLFMDKQKRLKKSIEPERTFLGDVHAIVDAVALGFGSSIVPEHVVCRRNKGYFLDEDFDPLITPIYLAHLEQPIFSDLEKAVINSFISMGKDFGVGP